MVTMYGRFNPKLATMRLNRSRNHDNPEGRLVLSIIKTLRIKGLIAGKVKVKGGFGKNGGWILDQYLMKGLPDVFCFDPKTYTMYGIEAKVSPNKQSDDQISFQKLFHLPPYRIYILGYSVEDVLSVINSYENSAIQ